MQTTFDIYETKIDVIESHHYFNNPFSISEKKRIVSDKKRKSEIGIDRYSISIFLTFSEWKCIDIFCLVIFSMISYEKCSV